MGTLTSQLCGHYPFMATESCTLTDCPVEPPPLWGHYSREAFQSNTFSKLYRWCVHVSGDAEHPGLCAPCEEHHQPTRDQPASHQTRPPQGKMTPSKLHWVPRSVITGTGSNVHISLDLNPGFPLDLESLDNHGILSVQKSGNPENHWR